MAKPRLSRSLGGQVSRRQFLGQAAAATFAFSIVPRRVLGGPGYVAPSDKINVAFIGVGSQGFRVMLHFLREPDVQGVAVCDANKSAANHPQWYAHEFCNSVRDLLGVKSGWDWLSPDDPIELTHSMKSPAGVSGRDTCQKIVDAYYSREHRSAQYHGCAAYVDFRELLEKEKGVDAVVVCTTDNLHAAVSAAAMKKGKHVFCQKPLTHTIYEAHRVAEIARETGVATQIAVANQASEDTRLLCEWIWDGAIGQVRNVENWSSRPFWPQAIERPKETQPIPEGLDWDLWLGPAPQRAFHHAYLPFVWRGWTDFGCGSLGDMGSYSFDTIFRVLKLEAPVSVEASSTDLYPETYPLASIVRYEFAARGDMPPVTMSWYDGGMKPARPDGFDRNLPLRGEGEERDEGLLFIGDRGKIFCSFNGGHPRLIPEEKMKNYKLPPKTLPRSPGNEREWLDACKGGKNKPGGNFEFSGMVTETLLLGNVATLVGGRLEWDRSNLKAVNSESAQRLVRPERRAGWEL
ncbi:MAG TPA: Gfo/Idh/MocA family oxidoreductase [Terriglobales bacterium]|jgi:predicted dehydrogenase|nr:Gfo/Idh/MocA family oxidoreductase [Terriglobales bacterium]